MDAKKWDAIVLTSQDQDHAQAFKRELDIRQQKGFIDKDTLLLSIEDPRGKVGSGGATLNALLVVSEHLSAHSGLTVVSSEVLDDKSILILHVGLTFPFSGCCHGFLPLPAKVQGRGSTVSIHCGLACTIDIVLYQLSELLAVGSPPGLWICSLDRMISIPSTTRVNWSGDFPVRLFVVPSTIEEVAELHGVCELGENNIIKDIVYQGTVEQLLPCKLPDGSVPAVSGIVYMNTVVTERLLTIHVMKPLDSCTYLGLDNGARVIKNLSLFYDMLLALAEDTSEKDFVKGRRSGFHSTKAPILLDDIDRVYRRESRMVLWKALHEFRMKGELIENGSFHYMSLSPHSMYKLLGNGPYAKCVDKAEIKFKQHVHVLYKDEMKRDRNFVAVNTLFDGVEIGADSVVFNSHLKGSVKFGSGCFILNIQPQDLKTLPKGFYIGDDVLMFSLKISLASGTEGGGLNGQRIIAILGTRDDVEMCFSDPRSTFCNKPWDNFLQRTGIQPAELWSPEIEGKNRCLLNARLFPIFNTRYCIDIKDVLWLQGAYSDTEMLDKWRSSWRLSLQDLRYLAKPHWEFNWRRQLYFEIGKLKSVKILEQKMDKCLLPFFRSCALENYFENILEALDNVARNANSPAVISRTFACIADVLGAKAHHSGGLRSGPAANLSWGKGLVMLKNGKIADAVSLLATERANWISRPDLLIRAARHYEGAFQVQVRKAVATAKKFINLKECEPISVGQTVTVEAPARMDIAGTWSDTPPICYEHGGAVITIGIKVDGKKPIASKVKKITEPKIVLVLGSGDGALKLECTEMSDLDNFSQPNSPGALLKAAFFCAEIISLDSSESLRQQLLSKYNCGFELQTGTDLPQGSGLGTSSILSGTVLAALWRAVGFQPDRDSLVHAVLVIEQMMTTGGGWQDQVGGLHPGVKVGSSKGQLPLRVESSAIRMPPGFLEILESHLILVFTGKTRLARNMLQDVLRNWNARLPEIVATADQLLVNAETCISAMNKGDLEGIGRCLDTCWEHKKMMAPGCEPTQCKILMNAMRPLVFGQCLAGAGGGGFSYAITKEPNAYESVKQAISEIKDLTVKPVVYHTSIDREGMVIRIEDEHDCT